MNTIRKPGFLAPVIFAFLAVLLASPSAHPQTTPPKMKMTTDIPVAITTPDTVDTRIGTLVRMAMPRTVRHRSSLGSSQDAMRD
jgi:hypothetical protein